MRLRTNGSDIEIVEINLIILSLSKHVPSFFSGRLAFSQLRAHLAQYR